MEVLVLGLPRTGTQSIAKALNILGYGNVYHMSEVGKNQHQLKWIQALEAKFESDEKVVGRNIFDEILEKYTCVSDFPAAIFAAELVAYYPKAKVILSIREEEKWYQSMIATLWHHWSAKPAAVTPMRTLADKYHTLLWDGDFPSRGRQYFAEHNTLIRSLAPVENFLEFDASEGWKPLCDFLGKNIPNEPFPRSDDWAAYKEAHKGETVDK